jgi:hypothetical protein
MRNIVIVVGIIPDVLLVETSTCGSDLHLSLYVADLYFPRKSVDSFLRHLLSLRLQVIQNSLEIIVVVIRQSVHVSDLRKVVAAVVVVSIGLLRVVLLHFYLDLLFVVLVDVLDHCVD